MLFEQLEPRRMLAAQPADTPTLQPQLDAPAIEVMATTTKPAQQAPSVTGWRGFDVASKTYFAVTSGGTVDLKNHPGGWSLTVTLNSAAKSVKFQADSDPARVESSAPFSLAGDDGTNPYVWPGSLKPGAHTTK